MPPRCPILRRCIVPENVNGRAAALGGVREVLPLNRARTKAHWCLPFTA
jgi:hypothetical protein